MLELAFRREAPVGSESQVDLTGIFTHKDTVTTVKGFYAGDGIYKIRFLPLEAGTYSYVLKGVIEDEGLFIAEKAKEEISEGKKQLIEMGLIPAEKELHGPVQADGVNLRYADGTWYYAFGTTVYALAHQEERLIEETMETLKNSPFNKIRMCVFPKHYDYNHNEPAHFAFHQVAEEKKEPRDPSRRGFMGSEPVAYGSDWDVDHPDFAFWDQLESLISRMNDMDIQVDLILFHPYDRWGLSDMGMEKNKVYLDYVIRRLASYPNIWWSLANEYDLMGQMSKEDWEEIGKYIQANDPYHHMLSCHNCFPLYDFTLPEVTHASIQSRDVSRVASWMEQYKKPVSVDECCYEGNLEQTFGSITAEEMASRFWKVFVVGGHCTHGETYLDYAKGDSEDAVIWWAKGGKLIGKSPERIAYLRKLMESLPGPLISHKAFFNQMAEMPKEALEEMKKQVPGMEGLLNAIIQMDPVDMAYHAMPELQYAGQHEDKVFIWYYGADIHGRVTLDLPESGSYKIDIIDTWNMTRETVMTGASGNVQVLLPGKQWLAVLAEKEN